MMPSLDHYNELSYESFRETYGDVTGNHIDISTFNNNNKVKQVEIPSIEISETDEQQTGLDAFDDGKRSIINSVFGEGRNYDVISESESIATSQNESNSSFVSEKNLFPLKKERKISTPNKTGASFKLNRLSMSLTSLNRRKTTSVGSASTEDGAMSVDSATSATSVWDNMLSVPASHLTAIEHKGYLDIRKRKKKWERFWCILQDSCLYCYNNPRSSITRHVILLRGYDVLADVINLKKTRFIFRLKQHKFPTYEFCVDNYQDYLLWVGSLEKQTRSYFQNDYSSLSSSLAIDELDSESNHSTSPIFTRTSSIRRKRVTSTRNEECDGERKKLLETIREQNVKLREECSVLEKIRLCSQELSKEKDCFDLEKLPKRKSCYQIRDFYEAEQKKEEIKSTVLGTFLSKRRHSVVLKLEDYKRELSPLKGLKRTDDHGYFSTIETRLRQMETIVNEVDLQFQNEELAKHNKLEMLRKRRDVELLLLEQREAIERLKKMNSDPKLCLEKRRPNSVSSPELVRKECFVTSSNPADLIPHRHSSTPIHNNALEYDPTTTKPRPFSMPFDKLCKVRPSSEVLWFNDSAFLLKPEGEVTNDDATIDGVTSVSGQDFDSCKRKSEVIDPDVLAFIEEFEVFAKNKIDQDKTVHVFDASPNA